MHIFFWVLAITGLSSAAALANAVWTKRHPGSPFDEPPYATMLVAGFVLGIDGMGWLVYWFFKMMVRM